jgi:hypothetical protein
MAETSPTGKLKSRVVRELDAAAAAAADTPVASAKSGRRRLLPSPEAATNLLIADIVVRSASRLFRDSVERRVARASAGDESEAEQLIDGPTMIRSLALYGASKLATRSPIGLGLVAGGLLAKTLYDRGKARQKREAPGAGRPPEGK